MSSPLWRFVNQQPTRTAGAAAGWVQMAPGVPCCLSSRNAPISSIVDGRLPPADASIRFHEESGEACPNHHQIDFAEVSMNRKLQPAIVAALLVVVLLTRPSMAQDQPTKVAVNWDKVIRVSQTTPTLQVVVNPPLQRGTPVHHNAFKSLHDLQADYVRYVPWLPYPKLGVAELEPPKDGKTSWDFSAIDPITIDFLEATKGHSAILNFSTIPQWMYKTDKPVTYPSDPNQVTWDYEQGTEL